MARGVKAKQSLGMQIIPLFYTFDDSVVAWTRDGSLLNNGGSRRYQYLINLLWHSIEHSGFAEKRKHC